MHRPTTPDGPGLRGLAPAVLVGVGGLLAALGSFAVWAVITLDLHRIFAPLPSAYRETLGGRELGSAPGAVLGGALVAAAIAAARPGWGRWAGAGALAAGFAALLFGLTRVVRLRALALAAIATVRPIDPELVSVSPGPGTFVMMIGAVIALAGGVLLVAGWDGPREGPAL